jgi:hypothetical protein
MKMDYFEHLKKLGDKLASKDAEAVRWAIGQINELRDDNDRLREFLKVIARDGDPDGLTADRALEK